MSIKGLFLSNQFTLKLFSYDHKWIPFLSPHTFAVFSNGFESFSISWLPEAGPSAVKVFGKQVKGRNFSEKETFKFINEYDFKLIKGGKYEIAEELYLKAKEHWTLLNSGKIEYKVTRVQREGESKAYHCVYAISDIITSPRMENHFFVTSVAMKNIKKHFQKYIISEMYE